MRAVVIVTLAALLATIGATLASGRGASVRSSLSTTERERSSSGLPRRGSASAAPAANKPSPRLSRRAIAAATDD